MFFHLYCVTLTTHVFIEDINKLSVVNTSKWYKKVKMTELTQVVLFLISSHIYLK